MRIIGQPEAKLLLSHVGRANILLLGPPGYGKTTIGLRYLCDYGTILTVNGAQATDFLEQIQNHNGPVLIDECHKLRGAEALYPLLDTDIAKPFAFGTTDEGELPAALYSRLIAVSLKPYSLDELGEIALEKAPNMHKTTRLACAKLSRGAPRRVKLFADLMKKILANTNHAEGTAVGFDETNRLLTRLGYPMGLNFRQVSMLRSLQHGAKSASTLAGELGCKPQTVRWVENELMQAGLTVISGRGRAITDEGKRVLEEIGHANT